MANAIHLLDVVALTQDIPAPGLRHGQVGTVVEEGLPGPCVTRAADLSSRFNSHY